jgi:phosphoribosylamine-glycine ligase
VFHAGTKKLDDGSIVTDGGRVLAVCAAGDTLASAVELAYRGVDAIEFEGKTVRRDIAHR